MPDLRRELMNRVDELREGTVKTESGAALLDEALEENMLTATHPGLWHFVSKKVPIVAITGVDFARESDPSVTAVVPNLRRVFTRIDVALSQTPHLDREDVFNILDDIILRRQEHIERVSRSPIFPGPASFDSQQYFLICHFSFHSFSSVLIPSNRI